jgi:hypothetical protein
LYHGLTGSKMWPLLEVPCETAQCKLHVLCRGWGRIANSFERWQFL